MKSHFILYVADQAKSTQFYTEVLDVEPTLDVPGMTEFKLGEDCVLGLMPESAIKRLLGPALPDPAKAHGVPRSEVYIVAGSAEKFHQRALANGGREISPVQPRDWGHLAGYSLDLDQHVLAFAEVLS